MAMLGDILGSARRSAARFQEWVEAADPELAETLKRAAEGQGESPSSYLRAAVADFGHSADEEAWAQLSRSVRDSMDPGMACLRVMVRWRMTYSAGDNKVPDLSRG